MLKVPLFINDKHITNIEMNIFIITWELYKDIITIKLMNEFGIEIE
jgi:hypothetical protein